MKKVIYVGNRPKVLDVLDSFQNIQIVKAFVIDQPNIVDNENFDIIRIDSKGQKSYLVDNLKKLDYDICVSAGCTYIIPMDELDPNRIYLNCHPSVLPLGKGIHPINECFISGNNIAGVTIHLLVNELDAGDIVKQISFKLSDDVDASLMYGFIFDLEAELLAEALDAILKNNLICNATPQMGIGSYYSREKDIRKFIADQVTVKEIINNTRAFSSSNLGVILTIEGVNLKIFSTQEIVNKFILERYKNVKSGTLIFMNNDVALIKVSNGLIKSSKFKVLD